MILMPAVVVLLMACFGILLNVYVLRRLQKFARKEPGRFENGCGLPLLVMSIADMLVLVGVVVFGEFGPVFIAALHKHSSLQNFVCKSMVYWMHVTTNVSIWCWVLMSAMRYMAVYHPFLQLRVSCLPKRGLQLIILLSLLLNATFIGAVEVRDNECQEAEVFGWRTAAWWFHLAEICWGFIVPVLFTLCIDGQVLLADPPVALVRRHIRSDLMQPLNAMNDLDASSPSTTNLPSYRASPRLRSTVLKWLAITSVDLLLNAPDNLLRLAIMFADDEQPVWQWYWPARFVSQLCYFGQFGFNACYLSLVVYSQSIKPKRSTTLAISVLHQSVIISSSVNTTGNLSAPLAESLMELQPISGCLVADQSEKNADNKPLCRTIRTNIM